MDLCREQKRLHNFNRVGPTKLGWAAIHKGLQGAFPGKYDQRQASNKLGSMKRAYHRWLKLQKQSGLGHNRNTGGVSADESFWEEHEEHDEHEDNESSEEDERTPPQDPGKPPEFLEDLEYLFGRTPQHRGNLVCAGGHNQGSPSFPLPAATPTRVAAGPSRLPDAQPSASDGGVPDPVAPQSPPKRPSVEGSVNSPKKKRSRSSIEESVNLMADTLVNCNIIKAQQHDDDMMRRVAQTMREDGFTEGTEMFYKALHLCADRTYRVQFLDLKDREGRIGWINFNWSLRR
ncbi:hypothetical protein EJB05_18490, partial [Eragrostis curvula]